MKKTTLPPIVAAILLAGCGGSGNGGDEEQEDPGFVSSVQITRGNAIEVVAAASGAGEAVLNLADPLALIGVVEQRDKVNRKIDIGKFSERLIRDSLNRIDGQTAWQSNAIGVIVNNTIDCDTTGTIVFTANDINSNNRLDSGETAGFTYNDCRTPLEEGGFIVSHGTVNLTDVVIEGDPSIEGSNWRLAFTANYETYSADVHDDEDPVFIIEFDGDLGLDTGSADTGVSRFRTTSISDFTAGITSVPDDISRARGLQNYSEQVILNNSTGEISREFDGVLSDTSLGGDGRIKIETPGILRGLFDDEHYTEGKNRFTGANGSSVTFTIIDETLIRLEVDEDGDGISEIVEDHTWDELLES